MFVHCFQITALKKYGFQVYQKIKNFIQEFDGPIPYRAWIKDMGMLQESTPSGWKLIADEVHYGELSEIMRASKS